MLKLSNKINSLQSKFEESILKSDKSKSNGVSSNSGLKIGLEKGSNYILSSKSDNKIKKIKDNINDSNLININNINNYSTSKLIIKGTISNIISDAREQNK